ncbi:hypothetical protein OLX02_13365 [Novosphingobium sp. KCTC 2891]|uniref:cupin domain-containing protein n=1 Tax=Novosphingobium sp. KCTC 2891 TaxID=2989730 RepID=UPI002222C711|nr:hypothetical protein [Novosphingobium sp. KCTC 2891]MCW1383809.1 hypothetical protein [Novosphingobium sp. KCTC 2891]
MDRELAYDISRCVHRGTLKLEEILPWDDAPCPAQVLRLLDEKPGAVRSAILLPPAGWTAAARRADGALTQIFVLSGTVRVGTAQLGAFGFAVLPADSGIAIEALTACEIVLICDRPGADDVPGVPLLVPDCLALEPFVPVIAGKRLDGFERRRLWLNERTGADTRLLKVPAHFGGVGGANWHPVEEEIYCISGDIQPDASRPMRAGSFLWNPAYSVHGFDERTESGCVLLEWHDGPWDLVRVPEADR